MTDKQRIAALEEHIAALEARLARVESRSPIPRLPPIHPIAAPDHVTTGAPLPPLRAPVIMAGDDSTHRYDGGTLTPIG